MIRLLLKCILAALLIPIPVLSARPSGITELREGFLSPPVSSHPGVYWYFMDGNISKEGMTEDLEAMHSAGISHVIFLEVNVGIPRGHVGFMSPEWIDCFKHAVSECERLDISMTLGIGPGWSGSGGPWVEGGQSMRHLVSSSTDVKGGARKTISLPRPEPMPPFFGEHPSLRTR